MIMAVEYQHRDAFLIAMQTVAHERKHNGDLCVGRIPEHRRSRALYGDIRWDFVVRVLAPSPSGDEC
jgi:hypothetical protein